MESEELIKDVIEIFEDHKAVDLVVFDVSQKSTLADYYVFCSGTSDVHIRALANVLGKEIKDRHQLLPRSTEGTPASRWILVDYADILIHIFHPELRQRYAVENLHKGCPIIHPGDDWEFPEEVELDLNGDQVPAFLRQ